MSRGRAIGGLLRAPLLSQTALSVCLFLLFAFAASSVHGQQEATAGPASELAQNNLSLVAASSSDIKAVLITNSGLLIELKAWVAKDATEHGQIMSESDLTDDAIYDRLDTDVKFRSIATRLLQRYGYLLPQVNPDSPQGKEQELLIQQRVKWIAQDEDEELSAAHQKAMTEIAEEKKGCGQDIGISCDKNSPQQQLPVQSGPQENRSITPIPLPPLQVPRNQQNFPNFSPGPGSSLEEAELLQNGGQFGGADFGGDLSLGGGLNGGEGLAGLSPSLMGQSSSVQGLVGNPSASVMNSNFGGGLFSDDFDESPFGPLSPQPSSTDGSQFAALMGRTNSDAGVSFSLQQTEMNAGVLPQSGGDVTGLNGGIGGESAPSRGYSIPRAPMQQFRTAPTVRPAELMRVRDPYSYVPSLYDMYLQAVPHPRTPTRFGMAVFENGTRDPELIPMDLPAGPDYVVGPGDGLSISLWGGVSQRLYRVVDREGRVALPDVGPVPVSGKTLADVQQNLQQVLRTQFRDVSVDVSISQLRTIRVYVVGDVVNPGAYDISSLSTPLNALFAAGGPTPQGSLRIVKHYRGGQLVQEVDLYDLLLHGVKAGLAPLENGDTVMVPPIGPQVTIEGMVRRPAIYELKDEKNLASVLDLAGGLLPSAALQHIEVQRTVANQEETMVSLDIPNGDDASQATQKLSAFAVHDGDTIRIFPIAPYNQNAVYLEGHVIRPGDYSYHAGMRVTDLISSYKDLLPEPATSYAEIIRLNAPDFRPSVDSFNLAKALADPAQSPLLQPMDTVEIFGRYDFENAPTVSVWGDVRGPGTFRTAGEIRLADAIHLAGGLSADAEANDVQVFRYLDDGKLKIFSVDLRQALAGDPTQNIMLVSRDRVLVHRDPDSIEPAVVYVKGDVAQPGRYPLTTNMKVADLVRAAGGLEPSADPNVADLTRYMWIGGKTLDGQHDSIELAAALKGDSSADVPLRNGDVVTIRELPGWNDLGASISVTGEVKHPGTYGIQPGERLSSILKRAGGLEADAYPYGAVFQRQQVRDLQMKDQEDLILRIKNEQHDLEQMPDSDPAQKQAKQAALAQYETTLTELGENPPVGRLTIRISSDIRRWQGTATDIVVQAGDKLFIPRRPSYVMVTGQVYNATAISYRPGRSAKWYLGQAGGPNTVANTRQIFVIRADGSVVGEHSSLWGGHSLSAVLLPGDTVVVPEKAIGPSKNWQNLFTTAEVASSVATAVVFAVHY
jgi:polysaccharide biosynthesis/export protein